MMRKVGKISMQLFSGIQCGKKTKIRNGRVGNLLFDIVVDAGDDIVAAGGLSA